MSDVLEYYDPSGLSIVFYDLICQIDPTLGGDAALYAREIPAGGSVLEFGCGTGRVTLELAASGFDVTGVDLSSAMLMRAGRRLSRSPAEIASRVQLVLGDMTSVKLGRRFDAVLITFFSLSHVSVEDWQAVFANVAEHMHDGAVAAVHLPSRATLAANPPRDPLQPVLSTAYSADGDRLDVHIVEETLTDQQFVQIVEYVMRDGQGREVRRSRERLLFNLGDPAPAARATGLQPDGDPRPLGIGEVFFFRKGSGAEA